jgi:HlyD family secretion protein
MPELICPHPDISQLKINRDHKGTNNFLPVHVFILLIIIISLIYLTSLLFPTKQDSTAKQVNTFNQIKVYSPSITNHVTKGKTSYQNNVINKKINSHESILDASGHIVARRIATVSSQVTGKLNRLNIEEGQRVSSTEILAELDDKQAVISHQLALAELSAKHASFEELQLLFKQQTQRFNRNQSLAKQQLISEQLLEDSQFKNAQLAIQVKNKKALVELATQRVALAQYQLNQHKIRAPFDGVVISKNAQVGELLSAGAAGGSFIRTGVGTIVDMSSLEIEVEVGESYINRVYAGQKVMAKLDAYPQWQINSEVVAVIPTADRQKASIKVRIKLFEIDPRILPDMGVKVSFIKRENMKNGSVQQPHVAALQASKT